MPDNDTLTLLFIKIGNWSSGEVNIIDFDDAIEIDKYIDIHLYFDYSNDIQFY